MRLLAFAAAARHELVGWAQACTVWACSFSGACKAFRLTAHMFRCRSCRPRCHHLQQVRSSMRCKQLGGSSSSGALTRLLVALQLGEAPRLPWLLLPSPVCPPCVGPGALRGGGLRCAARGAAAASASSAKQKIAFAPINVCPTPRLRHCCQAPRGRANARMCEKAGAPKV